MIKVVIDTNILVSALLTAQGNAASLLNLVLNDKIRLLYDNQIIDEYSRVLKRKKFGFDEADVNQLIQFIVFFGEPVVANPVYYEMPDKDELPFLEVAETVPANFLITGNLRDFPSSKTRTAIVSPKEFIHRYPMQ